MIPSESNSQNNDCDEDEFGVSNIATNAAKNKLNLWDLVNK